MTSVLRSFSVRKEGLTRFVKPESPCYTDTGKGSVVVLFPFSYTNGVLDISYTGNTFEADMVTNLNVDPLDETDVAYRITGGPRLVTGLGDNFKAYIRAWRDGTIDVGSAIEVNIPAQVIRVQEADYANINANSSESYKISTQPPVNDFFVYGDSAPEYNSTYIFKTPLTFTIVESGVTQYITFRSMLDQE